jgi:hypothetical protein
VQSQYVEKVLSRFSFRECEPAPTSYDPSKLLKKKSKNSNGSIEIFPNNLFTHVFS